MARMTISPVAMFICAMKSSEISTLTRITGIAFLVVLSGCNDGEISYQQPAETGYTPDIPRGLALFNRNCAACHGTNGEGREQTGAPDIRQITASDLNRAIRNVPLMAGLNARLGSKDRADIVAYLSTLEQPSVNRSLSSPSVKTLTVPSRCAGACHQSRSADMDS